MARIKIGDEVRVICSRDWNRRGVVKSASSRGYTVLINGRKKSNIFWPDELRKTS